MVSSSKRARKRRLAQQSLQRETSHLDHQMDPAGLSEPDSDQEDQEIVFSHRVPDEETKPSSPERVQAVLDCEITNMVKTLNGVIAAVSQDTARIQRAYDQLCAENIVRDLTTMVREYGSSPAATQLYGPPTPAARPRPAMQANVLDEDGNVRAADMGSPGRIMKHSYMVSGWSDQNSRDRLDRNRLCPHLIHREETVTWNSSSMITQPATPGTPVVTPDRDTHFHRPSPEIRQGYRPAVPIQLFNNKSLNWPAWFRHFRAVADVHGWNKDQRALQLVSYLDETAMNVAQELGDNDLYNYDLLVKLLSDRFDPDSRVSTFRSRFHGRACHHHEDVDTFADALAELCHVGYPQSPPEMPQELIAEQFVRGQSDPELKKYLWVVIRTQKDKNLQTLIEVCTDFSSLVTPTHLHRPAEQTFAVHQQTESYAEEDGDLENVFVVGDRPTPVYAYFIRPPCHLHASHRLQLLIHRILQSYLLNYI